MSGGGTDKTSAESGDNFNRIGTIRKLADVCEVDAAKICRELNITGLDLSGDHFWHQVTSAYQKSISEEKAEGEKIRFEIVEKINDEDCPLDPLQKDQLLRYLTVNPIDYYGKAEVRKRAIKKATRKAVETAYWEKISGIDILTDLPNRRRFGEYLRRSIESLVKDQRREEGAAGICLIMFDIDNFKEINDRLGHLAGDEALKKAAEILLNNFRLTDMVARHGGEEFVVIAHIKNGKDVEDFYRMTEQRRGNTSDTLKAFIGSHLEVKHGQTISAEAGYFSAGVKFFSREEIVKLCHSATQRDVEGNEVYDEAAAKMLDMVDKLLYEAKEGGKNRTVWPKKS